MTAEESVKNLASECLFLQLGEEISRALKELFPELEASLIERVDVTVPRDVSHGDMTTNAAMIIAKPLKRAPREIAQILLEKLSTSEMVLKAEIAGPGFLNFKIKPEFFQNIIKIVLSKGENNFGRATLGHGKRVNIEYVSANPTGPMHVGHCRGAVVGDALANLMDFAGYQVTKEYYINDAGTQVVALAWASYWRYLQAIGYPIDAEEFGSLTPNGLQYQGEYLIEVGEALAKEFGRSLANEDGSPAPVERWFVPVRHKALEHMMAAIKGDLHALGIAHEIFSSEAEVLESGEVNKAIAHLDSLGLLYEGVLEPPKGKQLEDWEARPQTLFRSTEFGDDVDRALRKSDGTNTYFANDIGYHGRKAARSDILIDVLGADHGGYVSRMKAAVSALTQNKTAFEAVLCQIVRVVKDGEPVRMSKRAGTFVTLRDLLDEVGRDAVRFTMLTRKADAQMEFDLNAVVAQTRDNPVFYVNYAHARCCSVLRLGEERYGKEALSLEKLSSYDLSCLVSDEELAVLRRIASFPRQIRAAANAREPHRIATYCIELASDFHSLWNRGREETSLRFIQDEGDAENLARLAFIAAIAASLRAGLSVLGVQALEELR